MRDLSMVPPRRAVGSVIARVVRDHARARGCDRVRGEIIPELFFFFFVGGA